MATNDALINTFVNGVPQTFVLIAPNANNMIYVESVYVQFGEFRNVAAGTFQAIWQLFYTPSVRPIWAPVITDTINPAGVLFYNQAFVITPRMVGVKGQGISVSLTSGTNLLSASLGITIWGRSG